MVGDSLRQIAPDLSERLRGETESRLRTVALAVCKFAVNSAGLESPVVGDVLERLEAGKGIRATLRGKLEKLAEDLDERYFEWYNSVEEGRAESEGLDAAFEKARAAAAVLAACKEDAFVAVTECIYEGWAAIDQNMHAIRRIVTETLSTAKSQVTEP